MFPRREELQSPKRESRNTHVFFLNNTRMCELQQGVSFIQKTSFLKEEWGSKWRSNQNLLGAEGREELGVVNVDGGTTGSTGGTGSLGVVTATGTAGSTTTATTESTAGGGLLTGGLGVADLNILDQDLGLLLTLAGLGNRVGLHLDEITSLLNLEDLGVLPLRVVRSSVGGTGLGEGKLEGLGGLLGQVVVKGLDNNLGLDGLRGGDGGLSGPI